MIRHARMAAVARVGAALLAVALSGAPRVAALHAPVESHRCTCAAHGGERACECALCKKAALRAQASDESAPPCHRLAAKKALADAGRSGGGDAPCLEGTCGSGIGHAVMTAASLEPFCLPTASSLVPARASEIRRTSGGDAPARALVPETPPPRPS
jgi:hypothetical protein